MYNTVCSIHRHRLFDYTLVTSSREYWEHTWLYTATVEAHWKGWWKKAFSFFLISILIPLNFPPSKGSRGREFRLPAMNADSPTNFRRKNKKVFYNPTSRESSRYIVSRMKRTEDLSFIWILKCSCRVGSHCGNMRTDTVTISNPQLLFLWRLLLTTALPRVSFKWLICLDRAWNQKKSFLLFMEYSQNAW